MGRITFYLLILAVILIIYVYLTKEKYLKPAIKHENFDVEEDTKQPVAPKPAPSSEELPRPPSQPLPQPTSRPPSQPTSQHATDGTSRADIDRMMEAIKTYNDNVVELNDNIKDMLAQNKAKQQPNFLWY